LRTIICAITLPLLANIYGCSLRAGSPPPSAGSVVGAPIGSVKDIMQNEVDPSSDAIWDSVSILVDQGGIHKNEPRTDAEWAAVRGQAIVLAEAANLLMAQDRLLTLPGQKIDGEGAPGNLTTDQAQRVFKSNHADFVANARAIQLIAVQAAKAAETKNVQGLLDTGEALDNACEACHLQFWYPPNPPSP
jgi:cytochrome c556